MAQLTKSCMEGMYNQDPVMLAAPVQGPAASTEAPRYCSLRLPLAPRRPLGAQVQVLQAQQWSRRLCCQIRTRGAGCWVPGTNNDETAEPEG